MYHKTCYGCKYTHFGSYEEPCISCTYEDGKHNWVAMDPEEEEEF